MVVLDRSFLESRYPDLESRVSLDLHDQGITSIAPDTFSGLAALIELILTDNHLIEIAPTTFTRLPSLTILHLNYNRLIELAPGTFAELSSVIELILSNNQLTAIAPGTFEGLSKLETLMLSNNRLTHIVPGTFQGLSCLTELYLSRNHLTVIAPGAFADMPRLFVLFLNENQLTELALDATKCDYFVENFLAKQHYGFIANDLVVEAMADLYPNKNLHQALACVPQLHRLAAFKSDHHSAGYRGGDKWCSPLRVRLLLLCKYVRDQYDLENYRYCSAQQLQRRFHLRAKLAVTAKTPLVDRLPEELVRHLCAW